MIYLLFRTDRIGDFLMIAPLIESIKRNDLNSQIYIVGSKKNFDYLNKNSLVDKVFLLKSNNLIGKIRLFFKLRKYKLDTVIVTDKKNRSIILSFFLSANKKIFNVSKNFQSKLLSFFYKSVFLDNDTLIKEPFKKILKKNCEALGFDLVNDDFHYLQEDQYKNYFLPNTLLDLDKLEYIIYHYDEKWEIENYVKSFKKASNLTPISTNIEKILKFFFKLTKKTNKKIIITTGAINTKLIEILKLNSKLVDKNLYEITTHDVKSYLLINQDFFSMSHLISKSKLFITCHGAFTHIASSYKVKTIDIIEREKLAHYSRITSHMGNHKHLYRDNFTNLSENIISNS